jgi:hypothetical protein
MLPIDPVSSFYFLAAASQITCWAIMSIADGCRDFHSRGSRYSLATKPTLFPQSIFLTLHLKFLYLILCHLTPFVLYVVSVHSNNFYCRLLAALVMSMYCLAETSVTNSHRDYLNMYTCWAILLSKNDEVAAGFALGFCILLISGSGWAKILIGGKAWAESSTLVTILESYHSLTLSECGPLLPFLNRIFRRNPFLITFLSTSTLIFECAAVPLCLLLPSNLRYIMMIASIGMHIGIGIVQSFIIGVAFLPNVATYYFGFGSPVVQFGTKGWYAACSCVIGWCLATFLLTVCSKNNVGVRLLPEDWPMTPFALFAWNGKQWNTLFNRYVTSNKRMVVYNSNNLSNLVGCYIVPRCWSSDAFEINNKHNMYVENIVYNGWELLCGETFCHSVVLEQLSLSVNRHWDDKKFVRVVSLWMEKSERFVKLNNGKVMNRVAYVEVDKSGSKITKVLAELL